jgi:hypothetical protein
MICNRESVSSPKETCNMKAHAKHKPLTDMVAAIASEMSDPDWREGFQDGQAARSESAPNMARGHKYAMGWITGRFVTMPPSLKVH